MSQGYRFDNCRILPAARQLWRGDELVTLPPQVFDFLTYLVERHNRAVGRDELVAAVWGKTEVSDTLIGQTVLRIRRELGDDAKRQQLLRTIPRFGYHFVAAVNSFEIPRADASQTLPASAALDEAGHVVAAPAAASALQSNSRPVAAMRKRRAWYLLALVVAAVLSIAVLLRRDAFGPAHDMQQAPANDPPLTSAVMPSTVEPGTEWSWMRLGVMDIVASRLRSSGLPSVPSEEIVAWLNTPSGNRGADLRAAVSARLVVLPNVQHTGSTWEVALDASDTSGKHFHVTAAAQDVSAAGRAAADKLLVALALRPPDSTREDLAAALVGRVDAAVLADDPDTARALIARASNEEQQSPELRLRLAKIDFRGGRLAEARARLEALLDEAPATTAPVLRASILNGLGAVAIREDKPAQAEQSFAESVGLLESRNEPAQLGQAYLGRAAAAAERRLFDAAVADYARARIAFRQANDRLALIRIAANEAFLDLDQDRPAQALAQFITATDGFRQWGALNEAVFTYIGQISSHLALLNNRAALDVADAAEAVAQHIDNRATLESLALAHARALAAAGRLREARETLGRLRRPDSDPITAAAAASVLARIELDQNDVQAAGAFAREAVEKLEAPSYAALRANVWLTQIRALLRSGEAAPAADALQAFEEWALRTDSPRARVFARLARAEYAVHSGAARAEWGAHYDAAREFAAQNAVPYEITAAAASYAGALFNANDLQAAAVEVGRVSRWSDQDFMAAATEARLYSALGRDEAHQAAIARARELAGEREIPAEALSVPVAAGAAR